MGYTYDALKDKIISMYPEIGEHQISVSVDFNNEKDAYVVTFMRGTERLDTYLDRDDADECMSGVKCVYLGVHVSEFISNFEERVVFGRSAA